MHKSPETFERPYQAEFENTLAQIDSPVDQAAFRFFYEATVKEGVQTPPGYTWDQFHEGIAPCNNLPIELADSIVMDARDGQGLVPNYTPELAEKNGLDHSIPLTEALTGPFVRSVHRHRQESAVRIVGIHPSMATPFVIARSLIAAYQHEFGEDIRPSINIVVGAYPTVMEYELEVGGEQPLRVSPVMFGRFLGNLVLTAPKTASTETDEALVREWMNAARSNFKVKNREIMAEPGNIMIVHPAGRRGKRSVAKAPPYQHIEYRPDSSLSYITKVEAPTFIVGVDDNLLNDPVHPESNVHVFGDPSPQYLREDADVIQALEHSALLASHDEVHYQLESRAERIMRLGMQAVGMRPESVES